MLDLSGKTALVTGASAGIGREIARVLARQVGRLVLVARRRDRLEELAAELKGKHANLAVEVRPVDLTDRAATGTMLDALEESGIAVDVLVNNAGFGDYGLFEGRTWEKTEQLLELNVVSATFLLHRLLPKMVERRFGAVLNVGSSAGMFPQPGFGTYSASKAYLNHLTEALRGEVAGRGVVVTALCPGPVPTEFQEVAGTGKRRRPVPAAFDVDAVRCAEEAIDALRRDKARVIPGLGMHAAVLSLEAVPRAFVRPFLKRIGEEARKRTDS